MAVRSAEPADEPVGPEPHQVVAAAVALQVRYGKSKADAARAVSAAAEASRLTMLAVGVTDAQWLVDIRTAARVMARGYRLEAKAKDDNE